MFTAGNGLDVCIIPLSEADNGTHRFRIGIQRPAMALSKPFSPRKFIAIVITARRGARHRVQFFQILHGIRLNVSHGLHGNDLSCMVLKNIIVLHFII